MGKRTMDLDFGDQHGYYYMLDQAGEEVEPGALSRRAVTALEKRFGCGEPMGVVIEAGTHSPWVGRLLAGLGHELVVVNPDCFQNI